MKLLKSFTVGLAAGGIEMLVDIAVRVILNLPFSTARSMWVEIVISLCTTAAVGALTFHIYTLYEHYEFLREELNHRIRNGLQIIRYSAYLVRKQGGQGAANTIDAACANICGALEVLTHVKNFTHRENTK